MASPSSAKSVEMVPKRQTFAAAQTGNALHRQLWKAGLMVDLEWHV